MVAAKRRTVHPCAALKTFMTDRCHVDHMPPLHAGRSFTRRCKGKVRLRNTLHRLPVQANKNVKWYLLRSSTHVSNHTLTSFLWHVLLSHYQDMVTMA